MKQFQGKVAVITGGNNRFGNPDNAADAVLFLASPRSTYILGAEISVDGGMSQL